MNDHTDPPTPKPTSKPSLDDIPEYLRRKMIEQGVVHTANVEHLKEAGKGLWQSDEEFEAFMELLRTLKKEKG